MRACQKPWILLFWLNAVFSLHCVSGIVRLGGPSTRPLVKEKLELGGITREANKQILLEVIDEDATYLGSKSFLVKNTGGKSAG
jgi:hypothetical protein